MNIEKAIEIKSKYQYILQDASLPELIEADNLSIEALKWIQSRRSLAPGRSFKLLPGETKAVDQRTANIGYGSSEALKKQRR